MLDGITVLGKKLCNFNKTVLAGIFIILGGNFEFWKNIANIVGYPFMRTKGPKKKSFLQTKIR